MERSVSWSQWKENNPGWNSFNAPFWYQCFDTIGRNKKGRNQLNFSGIDLSGVSIYKAFAEGLNLEGGIFKNTFFEEGDFSRANFSNAIFINTKFNKTILTDADFTGASFVNCNLNRVNLANAQFCLKEITETVVYGISAWDLHICDDMKQSKLIIEKTYELYSDFVEKGVLPLMVDNIEMAQFIYLLVNNKKLRNVIDTVSTKVVLILGRFTTERMLVLDSISIQLRKYNLIPIIFDFNKPDNRDITETISTIAHLSKFIIADITHAKSIPQELMTIIPSLPSVPIQPLLLSTNTEYGMFEHFKRYPWVKETILYDDNNHLISIFKEKIIDQMVIKGR